MNKKEQRMDEISPSKINGNIIEIVLCPTAEAANFF